MSRSSKSMWTAAEQAIEIPACPPDLSCPQYASLIFDKFCMVSNHGLITDNPTSFFNSLELPFHCLSWERRCCRSADKIKTLQKMQEDRVGLHSCRRVRCLLTGCLYFRMVSGRGLLPEGMDYVDLAAVIPGSGC